VLVISSGSFDDEQKSNVEQLPVKKPILSSASWHESYQHSLDQIPQFQVLWQQVEMA
jgi:hypothetical protein